MSRFPFVPAVLALVTAPLFLTAQSNSGQTDAALSRYVQPNANVLVSINWKLVRQSQAADSVHQNLLNATASIQSIPGIEFLNDVDRILISGRNPGQKTTDPELLMALGGHFDLAKVRKALVTYGLKPQLFNSVQVYRPQGTNGQSMAVVLMNAQTVLIGDPHSVFATLEHGAFAPAAPGPNSILARSADMESTYDIWVIGDGLNALTGDRMPNFFGLKELAAEEHGFQAGISLRNGFTSDISMRFESEEAAKTLVSKIEELLKSAAKEKGSEALLAELGTKLRITAEGPVAKINLHLTTQELETTALTLAATRRGAATASLATSQPVMRPTPVAPKPERRVIRIEGLDGGPVVIPYDQP